MLKLSEYELQGPDCRIAVTETGSTGLPVLMLHGSGSCKEVFRHQLHSSLADRFRLIAIDLPGHGRSSNAGDPQASYSLRGLAQTAGWVLDTMKLSRAVVLGWSLGGHVAIEMLGFHPGVCGLVLTGTPPPGRGPLGMMRAFPITRDMFLASKEVFTSADAEKLFQLSYGQSGEPEFLASIKRADGRVRTNVFRSLMWGDCGDQRRLVQSSQVPVTFINGANDPIVRLGYIAEVAGQTAWPQNFHVMPGLGHAPFWESPAAYNSILLQFLAEVEASGPAEMRKRA